MKIDGLTMDNAWAARALRERGVVAQRYEELEAEITVEVSEAELKQHNQEMNYRPFMQLTGQLQAVRPTERLPHEVHEVTFPTGTGPVVDAYYEFSDEQLARLTAKGYFNSGFAVPENITGIPWDLPAKVDAVVLEPATENDVPVVFLQVHDTGSLNTDFDSSGYDLVDYFEDQSLDALREEQDETVADLGTARVRTDAINPLFTEADFHYDEEELDAQADRQSIDPTVVETVEAEGLDAQLKAVEAQLLAEAEAARAEREAEAGTPENLYRERVAKALQEKDAPDLDTEVEQPAAVETPAESVQSTIDVEKLIEMDEDDELGVAPINYGQASKTESTKEKVARRAALVEQQDQNHDGLDY